jgi:hypothetical protein
MEDFNVLTIFQGTELAGYRVMGYQLSPPIRANAIYASR